MKCLYCGHAEHAADATVCVRCGAVLHHPAALEASQSGERDTPTTPCPSCGAANAETNEYCTQCGSPMAVITRVMELHSASERAELQTWRVYGIETKMFGRDDEIEILWRLHRQCVVEQRPRFVALAGATGIGKSRLIAEFDRKLARAFSEAVLVQSESRDITGGAFAMFARLFKNRFYIAEGDSARIAVRKMREAVRALIGKTAEAERIADRVGRLIGLQAPAPGDTGERPAIDPSSADEEPATTAGGYDRRAFDAVVDLLRADASQTPLVLVLEDLHFATEHALELVAHLHEHLHDAPILVILTYNHAELAHDHRLLQLELDHRLKLSRLTDVQVADFVRDTLHRARAIPALLIDKIVESAHGNPLAVEEMLRLLIAEGTIDTRPSSWLIHPNRLKKIKLPRGVEAAVEARLATLSELERDVLGMAATIGDNFWPDLIVCLARLHDDHLGRSTDYWRDDDPALADRVPELLESLERKDMVRRRDDAMIPGHEEMYFKHRIERKTIYETLAPKMRQRYHRLVAQWVSARTEAIAERVAEYVGHHYDQARCSHHAGVHYIEAARFARRTFHNRKAVDLYTRGLSYLSDADLALKMDALHDLGVVHDTLGEHDQALGYYRELLRISWLANNLNKGGVAYNKLGRAYVGLGSLDEALDHFRTSLELFWEAEDLAGIATSLDDIGIVYWIRGNYDQAQQNYASALTLRRRINNRRSIALSLHHLGSLKMRRGELKEAMRYFREALELRRLLHDHQGLAETYNNLGILCLERGELEEAKNLFEKALEIVKSIGHRAMAAGLLNNLGEIELLDGSLDQAEAHLGQAMELADDMGDKRIQFDIERNLALVALKRSERSEALERIQAALVLAEELGSEAMEATGLLTSAEIHAFFIFDATLRDEAIVQAEAHFNKALHILRGSGNHATLARGLVAYGQYLIERGETQVAKEALIEATNLYTELGIPKLAAAARDLVGAT